MQRVTLPEEYVKENMKVEISAKVASGYNADKFDEKAVMDESMTLTQVRKQCYRIYELGLRNDLEHFVLDMTKLPECVKFVKQVVDEYYPVGTHIPPHSRMRHLDQLPQFKEMMDNWECDRLEKMKRLIDLVFVSVLVDAGAGGEWQYYNASNAQVYKSSEGLGVASCDMFIDGYFSSDPAMKHRVNSLALKSLTEEKMAKGFQVTSTNKLVAVKNRAELLNKLGHALDLNPEFFGKELPRPGNIVDYLLKKATGIHSPSAALTESIKGIDVDMDDLWRCVAFGLHPIWPKHAAGLQTGDIWRYSKLTVPGKPGSDLVPFHKLTQWLLYSVIEVLEMPELLNMKIISPEVRADNGGFNNAMTALAEYRNGGLLVDCGVLSLKHPEEGTMQHSVGSELIVEWRALTLVLMDILAEELSKIQPGGMNLAQVLEGGTWRAGRIIARKLRPESGGPPIAIRSDGTVF